MQGISCPQNDMKCPRQFIPFSLLYEYMEPSEVTLAGGWGPTK